MNESQINISTLARLNDRLDGLNYANTRANFKQEKMSSRGNEGVLESKRKEQLGSAGTLYTLTCTTLYH